MKTTKFTKKEKFQIDEALKIYLWYEDADKETTVKAMAKAITMDNDDYAFLGDDVYSANIYFDWFRRDGTKYWLGIVDSWREQENEEA